MPNYPLNEDIWLVQELLGVDSRKLAGDLGISRMTLNRWAKEPRQATLAKLEVFYEYAFRKGIRLNEIHAQIFREEARARGLIPLFHGSKSGIAGAPTLGRSRPGNDFGPGFYCGESFQQSASFVARFRNSVCYYIAFDGKGLRGRSFEVDGDWMLAVALYRGKLGEFSRHDTLERISREVGEADYIVAPIADNRMFETIDSFIDGEITDVQCEHSLSATHLGYQYVLRSDAALDGIARIEPHYLCSSEKSALLAVQREQARVGSDKAKAARRAFRAQGRYIEEVLS